MRFGSGYKSDTLRGWIPRKGQSDLKGTEFFLPRGTLVFIAAKEGAVFTVIVDDIVVKFTVFATLEFHPLTEDENVST
jgi:hypothetical protein